MSNDEYQSRGFWRTDLKTNKKVTEIINIEDIKGYTIINGRKVRVLKEGVTKKHFNDHIDPNDRLRHLNDELILLQRWTRFYQEVLGIDTFEDGTNYFREF